MTTSRFSSILRITEIFHSIQGESTKVGLPTIFVRLTGCPLRCQYCDSAYAFTGGQLMSFSDIFTKLHTYPCMRVCVTGGEPLAQPACISFMKKLCDEGFEVSIETSGARDISAVDARVLIVMDLKTPDSNEENKNLLTNLDFLKEHDQIKFVICSRQDFEWAKQLVNQHQLCQRFEVLFSPSYGQINPTDLANWLIDSRLQARFQLQLHKILWNDTPGH